MPSVETKPCGCGPDQTCRKCRDLPKPRLKPLGIEMDGPLPFDPQVDISADARYISGRIVKHLWIIFVLLPLVAVVLYEIVK